jgi:hypothetical protein
MDVGDPEPSAAIEASLTIKCENEAPPCLTGYSSGVLDRIKEFTPSGIEALETAPQENQGYNVQVSMFWILEELMNFVRFQTKTQAF